MSPAVVVTEPAEHIVVVAVNRPDTLNSLDAPTAAELQLRLDEIAARDDVQVMILTGTGRGFCSGADLRSLHLLAESDSTGELMRELGRPVRTIAAMPQLTIAAVNGPAAGAGWGLAMCCDIRIASPTAGFIASFARMGLGPDFGLAHTLPRAVGRDRALEILLTARMVGAREAEEIGVVTSVAEDALAAALQLAGEVALVPGRAIRSIKRSLAAAAEADLDAVVDEIEAHAQARLLNDPGFTESARAWIAAKARKG